MLRKKNSEPAQLPEARQELLEFESPAVQPGKKDPKQFLKHNWKKITAPSAVPEPFPQPIPIRSSRW